MTNELEKGSVFRILDEALVKGRDPSRRNIDDFQLLFFIVQFIMLIAVDESGVVKAYLFGSILEFSAPGLVLGADGLPVGTVEQFKVVFLLGLSELKVFEKLELGKRRPVVFKIKEPITFLKLNKAVSLKLQCFDSLFIFFKVRVLETKQIKNLLLFWIERNLLAIFVKLFHNLIVDLFIFRDDRRLRYLLLVSRLVLLLTSQVRKTPGDHLP